MKPRTRGIRLVIRAGFVCVGLAALSQGSLRCLWGFGPAEAEVMSDAPLSITDLTARSEIVVIGVVVSIQSEWNAARTTIRTRVGLRADEVLKGSVGEGVVSFSQIGGQVGDIASVVAGSPPFTIGERVLLFLTTQRGGGLGLTGMFQGKFSLEGDSTGREVAVRRVPGQAAHLDQILLDAARERIRRASGG